jgi:hypothetical protein
MDGAIPTAAVDPRLQALREDMRRLLGPLAGQKVKLTQVTAAWRECIGSDAVFDLWKYQESATKRNKLGLRDLLMRIPDTVKIMTAPANARKPGVKVEWAVLIDVEAS